jgi:hypothetical protein
VIGNLSERPTDCEAKNSLFESFLHSTFLFRNYLIDINFFSSDKYEIRKCFINKTIELELPQKFVGIGYSYAIQAPEYNVEDGKKKYIQLMKLTDKIFIECLSP